MQIDWYGLDANPKIVRNNCVWKALGPVHNVYLSKNMYGYVLNLCLISYSYNSQYNGVVTMIAVLTTLLPSFPIKLWFRL